MFHCSASKAFYSCTMHTIPDAICCLKWLWACPIHLFCLSLIICAYSTWLCHVFMSFIISRKACMPLFPLAVPSICTSLFEKINTRTYPNAHKHTHTHTHKVHSVFIIISGNFGVTPDSQPLLPSERFIWSTAGSESDSTGDNRRCCCHCTLPDSKLARKRRAGRQRERSQNTGERGSVIVKQLVHFEAVW